MNSPPDWKIARARKALGDATKESEATRIGAFREVMKHVSPAMRLHFLESQRDPTRWYQTRLAFTRSVATTSIVGHILGLGDRHASNIMLDQSSGEVVPIDLGIAFDAVRPLRRVPIGELM